MSELTKERREELHKGVETAESYGYTVPVHPDELRALLDMADERDMFRALLVEARSWIDGDKWKVTQLPRELVNLYLNLVERIDAALEGKHD